MAALLSPWNLQAAGRLTVAGLSPSSPLIKILLGMFVRERRSADVIGRDRATTVRQSTGAKQ